MKTRLLVSLWIAAALVSPVSAQQNPFAAARDLYASARYDEALVMLNGMQPAIGGAPDRRSIEQYRSLCLLALGRGPEAESAIAAVVTADPLYVPGRSDSSPRVRTAFGEVRQRLLPEIARARYMKAKAAFDRKDHSDAERQFRGVLLLLNDPQMGGRLSDLRELAAGFLDLSTAAAAPLPPVRKPEPKKLEPAPPPPPPIAVRAPGRIWIGEEPGVTPPVPIRQEMPRVQASIQNHVRDRGLLEVIIDEQGRVVGLTIRSSVHPIYDTLLMTAARDWRYQPATVGGVPVKFKKLIQIRTTTGR
jgi:TonB family protein